MVTRNLVPTAIIVACAMTMSATIANAAVIISTVGDGTGFDVTNQPSWLSTDVAKTTDLDGDNVYGTDGYLMFGTTAGGANNNGQSWGSYVDKLPSWATVSEPTTFDSIADQFAPYVEIDDPNAGPGASVPNWTARSGIAVSNDNTGVGAWNALADFTIGAGTPQNFRVGVLAGNGDGNGWDPTGVRISGPDASIASVTVLPVTSTADWVFFDVDTGGANSGMFTIEAARRNASAQGSSIGGFTFDAAPADIVMGDVISIDFGPTAPDTANWNQFDYDGTGGETTVNNLIRLSDGAKTGVEIEVTSIEGDTLTFLDGSALGGSSEASIYEDGIHSTGSFNDSLFITIRGLDDSLKYNLFGGSLRGGSDFGADWIIDGVTYSALNFGNSFVSVWGVSTTSPGEILIHINDPNNGSAPANNRNLGLAEFTITAAVPEPSTLAISLLGTLGLLLLRHRKR